MDMGRDKTECAKGAQELGVTRSEASAILDAGEMFAPTVRM